MQADGLFAQRPAAAFRSQRSTLGDQPSQDCYLIVQSAGEMRLCSGAQARSIASKPGDGAAVVDVVAVGLGQIPVYVAPKSGGVDRSRRAVKALRHPAREAEIAE